MYYIHDMKYKYNNEYFFSYNTLNKTDQIFVYGSTASYTR